MEFEFTEEEKAFRREVKEARKFDKKLGERGWLNMHWPKEYGGQGASHMMQLILREEMSYVGASILDGQGVYMIGPCIMIHGTEEQKKRFLPPIANSEVFWSQGFSEPNAGSDLASLQLRAVKDGDDFIYLWTVGETIYAGSNEIQRNIMAQRGLGLPRE